MLREVQQAEELLNLVDQHASPVDAYVKALKYANSQGAGLAVGTRLYGILWDS